MSIASWRPFLNVLALAAILPPVALAADITGKWYGVFHVVTEQAAKRDDKAVLILKQQGDEVTGTLGATEENQLPFKKGKMTGNVLSIEMDGNPVVFTLKLDGNKLTGDIRDAQDRSKVLGQVDLTRNSVSVPSSPLQTPESDSPTKQLEKLYAADQSDPRPNGTPEAAQATEARAQKRCEQIAAILAQGGIQSAEDYFRAATVFQHREDHLMAHILATIAGYKGHKRARWLSAAALDAYLQSAGKSQIFGTVYLRDGQRKPFDKAYLSDALREGFCIPPLAEQDKNVQMLKNGGSPLGMKRIASSCEPVEAP